MQEIIKKKEELCENIKEMINEFLKENNLEFSSLYYDVDWNDEKPKLAKLNLKLTI